MKLFLVLLAVVLLPSALAATSLFTVNETVNVDFTGERAFALLFPNGATRQFTWQENETHSDVTFDHVLYIPFTEENYCNTTAQFAETYKNMTNTLSGLTGICGGVLQHLNTTVNVTENLTNDVLAAKRDRDEYLRLWKLAESKFAVAENATILAKADCETVRSERDAAKGQADTYRTQADTCVGKLDTSQRTTIQTTNTDTALKDCEDSKTVSMAVAGLIAGVLGFFLGRKGRGGGFSEQAEVGAYGDRVRPRPAREELRA